MMRNVDSTRWKRSLKLRLRSLFDFDAEKEARVVVHKNPVAHQFRAAVAVVDDDDGMPNFYEYALNGNPTNSADIGIVEYSQDGSFFTYIHGKRLDDASLVYTLEDTENLVTGPVNTDAWDSQTSGPSGEAGFDAVTNKYDMTGKDEQFIQLIIE